MNLETIIEVGGGFVFLCTLAYLAFAPVKIGKPYLDGTEVLGPGQDDGDRH